MWNICWQQKGFAFVNVNVSESSISIDNFKQQLAFDLIKKFLTYREAINKDLTNLGGVNVIITSVVWPSNEHNKDIISFEDTTIAYRGCQVVLVLCNPIQKVYWHICHNIISKLVYCVITFKSSFPIETPIMVLDFLKCEIIFK